MVEQIAVPRVPYLLRYGRCAGKSLEELPFLPGFTFKKGGKYVSGYDQLGWFARNSDSLHLKGHAKMVKLACDAKRAIVTCQCGKQNPVSFAWIAEDNSGITISHSCNDRYCQECARRNYPVDYPNLIPFEFSSIGQFKNLNERKRFLELFKYCLFGSWNAELTALSAFNYLFFRILPVVQGELFG